MMDFAVSLSIGLILLTLGYFAGRLRILGTWGLHNKPWAHHSVKISEFPEHPNCTSVSLPITDKATYHGLTDEPVPTSVVADIERSLGINNFVDVQQKILNDVAADSSRIIRLEKENKELRAGRSILLELLLLKRHKEKHGKTEHYLRCKELAWSRAKEILRV